MVTEPPPAPLVHGVLLEIGHARVTPSEARPIASWVAEFARTRRPTPVGFDLDPVEIECVLPAVTFLEKVDARCRHYPGKKDAASFLRHFEDAAEIANFLDGADPGCAARVKELFEEMVCSGDISRFTPEADALRLTDPDRNEELEVAWQAAAGLRWGERTDLAACVGVVRAFLERAAIGS